MQGFGAGGKALNFMCSRSRCGRWVIYDSHVVWSLVLRALEWRQPKETVAIITYIYAILCSVFFH